MQLVIIYLII